jgi:hypothetical protein
MCSLKLPLEFLDHIIGSSRGFFCRGKQIEEKGKWLVKWEKICRPKKAGGIGILNLRTQNIALIMKNLFKFMNKQYIPYIRLLAYV